jgi:D-3-phosphoglycerate dehydrogenase
LDSVDLDAAADLNITVCRTPDAPARAVAELTLALILSVIRNVAAADRSIRDGAWQPRMGSLLAQKTVGLVGGGRVGERVARLVQAFGARVLVHDPALEGSTCEYELVDLPSLLGRSDIVSLHLPYSDETHHMIGDAQLAAMREGSILINTSRGGLIDEDALVHVMVSGKLGGVGLDVFEHEPYEGPLTGLDTAVLTAHMGSYARETRLAMEQEALDNLLGALEQEGLI